MREKQIESPQTLLLYLKIIHTLRYMSIPFLPNITLDERKRLDEGNIVNYGKAKNVFLSLVQEEGYTREDFKHFDDAAKQYIEEHKPAGEYGAKKKKKAKGGNPLDEQYINIDIYL